MFTLLVCADVFGSKVNLELTFSALPTVGELTRRVEEVFTAEMHAIKPPGASCPAEGIAVSGLRVYDEDLLKWVGLSPSTQLHENDQVYVFQPQTSWPTAETQLCIPPPRLPRGAPGSVASERLLAFARRVQDRATLQAIRDGEMFTLLVCANMFGSKVNLELTFSALPTVGELTCRVEEVFTAEMHAVKPPGASCPAEGIAVRRLQVYDDGQMKWVGLSTSTQLHKNDQVYAFQPQTSWPTTDTQQDLPAPRPPTSGRAPAQAERETETAAENFFSRTPDPVGTRPLYKRLWAAICGRGTRR